MIKYNRVCMPYGCQKGGWMGKSIKGKELGKNIHQNKDGRYIGRFTDRFGKRISVTGTSLSEVRKRLRDAQYQDERMMTLASPETTLDEWFITWKEVCKSNCRQTTLRTYEACYKRIKPYLGAYKLRDLNIIVIQQAFNKLKTDMSRKKSKAILVDMLNCAIDADMLLKNPAIKIKTAIKGDSGKERHVLSDQEIELVLKTAKESKRRIYPILVVGFNTGMRIGEILGLTWDNIDFAEGVIHVRKNLAYVYSEDEAHFVFNPPKTKAGLRDIPMTKEVKVALLEQKMRCNRIYNKHEPLSGFENLVFPGTQNRPIDATHIGDSIKSLIKKIEKSGDHIEYFTPHCMRHTFATKCIAKGMKPKVLQKILGHTSLQMTMDLYCHVEDETVRNEMALFAVLA